MDIDKLVKENTYPRDYRKNSIQASLNPAIALALNQIAGIDSKDRILDPCCGTATILIERQLSLPAICVGVDINPKVLDLAKENINLSNTEITLKHGDITELKFPESYFTKIISNLPYGIKSGSRQQNIKLYRFLADKSISWLKKGGKAVFITNAKTLLKNSFSFNESWQLIEEYPLEVGRLNLSIFVYQKI